MKLRENLKKEDFYGCFFGIQNLKHGEDLQNALFSLGFEWFESNGLHAYGSGFLITMPFGPRIVHNSKLFPFSSFTEKKLSDIVESDVGETVPNQLYVKCSSVTVYDDPQLTFGKIYEVLSSNDFYKTIRIKVGDKVGSFPSFKFDTATQQEYIEQEGLNFHNEFKKALKTIEDQEEEAYQENKKTFDENIKRTMPEWVIKRTKEELIKQGYQLITEEQIATLADISPTVKAQLREFFPEAKCLQPEKKEPETTYSIGDRFLSSWGGKEYMLSTMGGGVVGLINLEYGTYAGEPLKVENVYCISESEMNELKKLTEFEFTRI